MATDLERLILTFSADLKQFENALAKTQGMTSRTLRKVETDMQGLAGSIEKGMGRLGSAIKGGIVLAVALAADAMKDFVRNTVSHAADIGVLAEKLGISTAKLQELQHGARAAGIDFGELSDGLLKFSKNLSLAQNGQGDLNKLLLANGFTQAQIRALSYSDALNKVADLVKNARNEQEALQIIIQTFGKGSDEYILFLKHGSEGLRQMAQDLKDLGGPLEDTFITEARTIRREWDEMLEHMEVETERKVLTIIGWFEEMSKHLPSDTPFGGKFGPGFHGFGTPAPTAGGGGTTGIPLTPGATGKADFAPANARIGLTGAWAKQTKLPLSPEEIAAQHAREEAIKRVITALSAESLEIGRGNVLKQIEIELTKAGTTADTDAGKKIVALVEKNEMLKAQEETRIFLIEEATRKQEEFAQSLQSLAQAGVASMEEWILNGGRLTDVLGQLTKQLAEMAIQAMLFGQGPMAGLFGTSSQAAGGGGLFGSLIGGLTGATGAFGGIYAAGGTLGAGKWGIAGEGGVPEVIHGPANITPLGKTSMGLGGTSLNIVINAPNADAAGLANVRLEIQKLNTNLPKIIRNTVTGEKSLNPRFGT